MYKQVSRALLQWAFKHYRQSYPRHEVCQSSITDLLLNLLNRSMSYERGDSPQTATELSRALNSYYGNLNHQGTMNAPANCDK